MSKSVALTIDCGGSQARVLPLGRTENQAVCYPNQFYSIPKENFRVKEVVNPTSLLNIMISPEDRYNGYFAAGVSAKAYDGTLLSINSTKFKTETEDFYKEFVYMVAQGVLYSLALEQNPDMETLEDIQMVTYDNIVDIVDVIIGTNIPIKEHSGRNDMVSKFKNKLAGIYSVEFPLLENNPMVRFRISEDNMGVMPEGGVCISALGNKIGKEDYTMVVDLGHVSDDIAIFCGTQIVAMESSSRAGSMFLARLESMLADNGYRGNAGTAYKATVKGEVDDGSETIDVSQIVKDAQRDFVQSILKVDIVKVLTMAGLQPSEIKHFIPIGQAMQQSPFGIDVISEITSAVGMEKVTVWKVAEDLRFANLLSVSKFTNLLKMRFDKTAGR